MVREINEIIELSLQNPKYQVWATHMKCALDSADRLRLESPESTTDLEDSFTGVFPYYDRITRQIDVNGQKRRLSRTEQVAFEFIARNSYAGRVTPGIDINRHIFHDDSDPNQARTLVMRIRRKIEVDYQHPQRLLTFRGWGYLLIPAGQIPQKFL